MSFLEDRNANGARMETTRRVTPAARIERWVDWLNGPELGKIIEDLSKPVWRPWRAFVASRTGRVLLNIGRLAGATILAVEFLYAYGWFDDLSRILGLD